MVDFSHIEKLHRQEMENKKDKKLHSKVTGLFHAILTLIIFALIIFFNLSYYDKTNGFRTYMTILMFVFVIMIPILGSFLFVYYSRLRRHKRR